jgi:hypothetical protein
MALLKYKRLSGKDDIGKAEIFALNASQAGRGNTIKQPS